MKLQEVTGYNSKTAHILKESYQDLTESQVLYLGKFEKELWPLVEQYTRLAEAELTRDQIIDIFNGAEQVAMSSGDNKTIAGKIGAGAAAAAKLPVDIAKKVDAKINELGRMAQNAGPIKNMDQKFEDLKKQITANNSDSKIVQGIQKISDWAKENPGKASLAVGILTTMAAFAGGPAGGAAAGLILRASKDLLQGEKLSSAVGSSIKTGVYGFLAGKAFQYISDNIVDNIASAGDAELASMEQSFKNANYEALKDMEFAGAGVDPAALEGAAKVGMEGNINAFRYSYDTVMTPDQLAQYDSFQSALSGTQTFSPEYYAKAADFHEFMAGVQNNPENIKLTGLWDALKEIPKDMLTDDQIVDILNRSDSIDATIKGISNASSAIGSTVQGAIQAAGATAKQSQEAKPVDAETKQQLELDLKGGKNPNESLTMEERFELYLLEADPAQGELPLDNPNSLSAKLKRGAKGLAGKAAGAVKGAASSAAGAVKQGAKDLGNKVTANKLMKSWKAMGEPLDSGSIANILQDAGMSDDQIKQIGQTSKVELEPSTQSSAQASDGAQDNTQKGATSSKKGPAVKDGPIEKGTVFDLNGKQYRWAGALWVDVETNKPLGVEASFKAGLPNPRLQPIIDAAKKDPELAKLIKAQVTAKGVKPGTADAAKAAQAGVKGTEKLKTA